MTNEDNILTLTEYFNGTITAYVSDYHRCRNRNPAPEGGIMDIDPKDFVVCLPEGRYADTDKSDNSSK